MVECWIGWKGPPHGWMKMNVDGATRNGGKETGAGDLLRNEAGRAMAGGFLKNIWYGSALKAEATRNFDGLKLPWTLGVKCIVLKIDSRSVAGILLG